MKIGVISDTHIKTFDLLPSLLRDALGEVDLIVHAGDITEKAVLDGLMAMKKVVAVSGNMDSLEIKGALPAQMTFEAGGKKIGLVHGAGGPSGIAERVRDLFEGVDIIIYGHSHRPYMQNLRGVLMFNPGAAGDSLGIITIDGETVKTEIRPIEQGRMAWPPAA